MICLMTTARPQQRYDHRLRELVQRTGNPTIATDRGVPRSTARGWLRTLPTVVVSVDVADLTELELREEVLKLRRRVQKLAALLRLALTLLRISNFTLASERLPDGCDKQRIMHAIDQAHACIPMRALLRLLRLSPSRFHAWRRRHMACALDDPSSCPRTSPHRLTPSEIRVIKDMVTAPDYRPVPTCTRAILAQRLGRVWAAPSTWYRLVQSSTAGGGHGSVCIRRNRRSAFARRGPTRCGTSTRRSSGCSTGPARISMRSSTTFRDAFWRSASTRRLRR